MGLGFSSILIPVPRGTAAADIIILIFALLIAVKLEIGLGRLEGESRDVRKYHKINK